MGLIIVVFTFVLALLLLVAARRELLTTSAANVDSLAQQMARELSSGMDGFERDVSALAVRDRLRDPNVSRDSAREVLNQLQLARPEFAFIGVVDAASAKVFASAGGLFENGDARGRPAFEEGLKGVFLGDVHNAVRLAELLPRPANGEPLRFLDVAAPIKNADGQAFRVLAVHVSWQWTAQLREQVLGPVELRRGVQIFLVDTAGKLVLSAAPELPIGTPLERVLASASIRNNARTDTAWGDGRDYLTSVARVEPRGAFTGFGWRVVVRQPVAAALGPVHRLQWIVLTAALAIGALAALLGWWLTGRIVRPVQRLASVAENWRPGASTPRAEADMALREVQAVEGAFARMNTEAARSSEHADRRERQFRTLAESLPAVVWQSDREGRIEYLSRPIELDAEHGLRRLDEFAHLMERDAATKFNTRLDDARAHGKRFIFRAMLTMSRVTQPRWHQIEAHPVMDDDGVVQHWLGMVSNVHDEVLDQQRTERQLVDERSAREDAERVSRMKDEFLATVSHELRSPLSAITGWADVLARSSTGDENLSKAIDVIRRNAHHQAALIDELLDMSAVIAGKVQLEWTRVDIVKLAQDVVQSHTSAAAHKGVTLAIVAGDWVPVLADERRLRQVMVNLISNAIKFTDSGGRVEVRCGLVDGKALFSVTDTGCGISKEFLPYVFDRLRQEDGGSNRKHGGLGLGLSIAKALMDLHHALIDVHSDGYGCGSTFRIVMKPMNWTLDEQDLEPGDLNGIESLNGLRVLVVDDEADARDVACALVRSLGAQPIGASGALQALELARTERFDLVLSDVGMPVIDGLMFMRSLRALAHCGPHELPAIALTAFAMAEDRQRVAAAGFQGFIAKPVALRELADALLMAARSRSTSGARHEQVQRANEL